MCLSFEIIIEFKKLIKGHRGGGNSVSEGRTEYSMIKKVNGRNRTGRRWEDRINERIFR